MISFNNHSATPSSKSSGTPSLSDRQPVSPFGRPPSTSRDRSAKASIAPTQHLCPLGEIWNCALGFASGGPTRTQATLRSKERRIELQSLFTGLFTELHQRAQSSVKNEKQEPRLQATALISEVYLRLNRSGHTHWHSTDQFLQYASRCMRAILVEHQTHKRHWNEITTDTPTLDHIADSFIDNGIDLEKLDLALLQLESEQPEMAQAVQLRFFGGLSMQETARILGIPLRTLERRWLTVRGWLKVRLQ